jgi:hypothetical protein
MKTLHTPGPWKVIEQIDYRGKIGVNVVDNTNGIAYIYNPEEDQVLREKQRANAHLIAAAPELLAALEICWNSLKTYGNHPLIKMKVEAAIDKATGKKERVQ